MARESAEAAPDAKRAEPAADATALERLERKRTERREQANMERPASSPVAKGEDYSKNNAVDFSGATVEGEVAKKPERGQSARGSGRILSDDGSVGGSSGGGKSADALGTARMRMKEVGNGATPNTPLVQPKQSPPPPPDSERRESESYKNYGVNAFTETEKDRLSTFSVDVDTASYTITRRKILEGVKPPPDSVRVEEYLNYFRYSYASPKEGPFAVYLDAAPSPFDSRRHFLRVGVQGKTLSNDERKPAHLTLLVDVSGSMRPADRLPLAKKAMRILVDNLRDGDSVSIVTYAGTVRDVLPPTGIEDKAKIIDAIDSLQTGGGTAMASGIDLAYKHAAEKLGPDSISRVIILTDGDANVGPHSQEDILYRVEKYVKQGVTLSVVGFGMGNYKDNRLEQLADKGNGNYSYCDSIMQAKRIFQENLGGTLEVIAKDVKLQVEFDPKLVKRYRLVGYENRDIADRDFRNDKVDAGEIGSGHTVTALYELELADGATSKSFATVRVRAKPPRGETAAESSFTFNPSSYSSSFDGASKDLRFAVAVAGAADVFRNSPWAKEWSLTKMQQIAKAAADGSPERLEFVSLLERALYVYAVASR